MKYTNILGGTGVTGGGGPQVGVTVAAKKDNDIHGYSDRYADAPQIQEFFVSTVVGSPALCWGRSEMKGIGVCVHEQIYSFVRS